MSGNGEVQAKGALAARVDPARVRALEQAVQVQTQMLVNRALGDLSNLLNALDVLTQQANAGQPQARQVLQMLFANLDTARAASAGIITAAKP